MRWFMQQMIHPGNIVALWSTLYHISITLWFSFRRLSRRGTFVERGQVLFKDPRHAQP